ncbi:MAG: aldehyde dehydrogenase [Chloroflexi bacterium]|nr:aldehyde dehydrogenase [Chloroflexota bacterium]
MARQISPAKDLPHWNSLPEVPALTLLETLKYDLLIHGEWRPAKSGDRFDVENPATGKCIASMANAGESDVADAVESAQRAFTGGPWSTMTGGERGRIMWKMADLIEERADELGNLESISNGRPISETSSQMAVVASYFRYFAGFCDKIQGTTIPTSSSHLNYTTRVPLGVVGQLTPWNHPLMIASKKLAPALAAGCTVVLKPSEWAPLTPTEIGVIALEAGLPPGVLNIVNGFGPTSGKALASDSRLGKLDLTGGTETGRTVAKLAGENLTPLQFELGGKAPVIVFDDVNVDDAVNGCAFASFIASGQTCIQGSRAIVQRAIYDEFVEKLSRKVAGIRIGDPTDPQTQMGPVISRPSFDRVLSYVRSSVDEGARIAYGGKKPDGAQFESGYFIEPTVLADVRQSMKVAQEEIFGPVVCVIPFETESEAVEIANDIPYGLGCSIWTRDVARAHRVARDVIAGVIWINDHHRLHPAVPWGGFKDSGYGREGSFEFINEYTASKYVCVRLDPEPVDWYGSSGTGRRLN